MGIIKSCLNFVLKPAKKARYTFSEEDRERSLVTRRLNEEKRKLKHEIDMKKLGLELAEVEEALEEFEPEPEEDDDNSDDNALLKVLKAFQQMAVKQDKPTTSCSVPLQPLENGSTPESNSVPVSKVVSVMNKMGVPVEHQKVVLEELNK